MTSQLLQGRVVDAFGGPPSGAVYVHRFSLRAGSRVVRLKAGNEGAFEMPIGIPAVILASSTLGGAGTAPATGYEARFTVTLQTRLEIRGRVVDREGAPVEGARISQVYVVRFVDKLLYLTPPNDEGRVVKRGSHVYLAPCFCLSGMATTDAEGRFRLFGLPPCGGQVLLRVESPEGSAVQVADTFWIPPDGSADLIFAGRSGPAYRLPDGRSVEDLPIEPPDPAVGEEPLPPITDPHELRRQWIWNLRRELLGGAATSGPPDGKISRPEVIPDLADALNDPDPEVRAQAVVLLAWMNIPDTLEALIAGSRNPDPVVRRDALIGLGWLARHRGCRDRAVEALRRAVEDGDPSINIPLASAAALAEIGEAVDPGLFYDALRRNDADERVAARALARLLRRDAVALILARMKRSDHREALGRALEALTGAKHGDRLDLWTSWLETKGATLPRQAPTEDRLPGAAAYFRRAQERVLRKDARGARADLDETLRRDGPSAPALALRAWLRADAGDLNGALADVDQAVALDPRDGPAWGVRAAVLERRGDAEGAARDARKAAEALSNSAWLEPLRERLQRVSACPTPTP